MLSDVKVIIETDREQIIFNDVPGQIGGAVQDILLAIKQSMPVTEFKEESLAKVQSLARRILNCQNKIKSCHGPCSECGYNYDDKDLKTILNYVLNIKENK